MKTLFILATMATILILGCTAELPPLTSTAEPTTTFDVANAARPTVAPIATPTPSLAPTATPLPEADICDRPATLQRWILQHLQIAFCHEVFTADLYRIDEGLHIPNQVELKPGDLAGLVNVPRVEIGIGHCGDWENPEYTAAILRGFNPDAQIRFKPVLQVDGVPPDGWTYLPSMIYYPDGTPDSVDEMLIAGWDEFLSLADLQTFPDLARQARDEMNRKAMSIAQAVRDAGFGKGGAVRMQGPGLAIIIPRDLPVPMPPQGWQTRNFADMPATIAVEVEVHLPYDWVVAYGLPDC